MSKDLKDTILGLIFIAVIFFIGLSLGICIADKSDDYIIEYHPISIEIDEPEFMTSDNISDNLMEALEYYDIKCPHIVQAQAILETGHFKSTICKEYNNLFGLYNSRTKDYYKFSHWSQSVLAYKNYIQYKYTGDNNNDIQYYNFLDSIGYAEDPQYLIKISKIVNKK